MPSKEDLDFATKNMDKNRYEGRSPCKWTQLRYMRTVYEALLTCSLVLCRQSQLFVGSRPEGSQVHKRLTDWGKKVYNYAVVKRLILQLRTCRYAYVLSSHTSLNSCQINWVIIKSLFSMVLEIRSYVRIAILLYQQYFQLSVATFLIAGVCLLQELHSFTGTSPQHCGRRV